MRGTRGKPHVARAHRGWRVRFRAVDEDGQARTFTSLHDTWTDALEHALELSTLGS